MRIKEIDLNDGIGGIDYSGGGIRTNNISKMTENIALRNIEDKMEMEIEKEIIRTKVKLDRLDAGINSLSDIEADIIKYRYKEELQWIDIADITLYSERNCKYKLVDAKCKLAVIFYG